MTANPGADPISAQISAPQPAWAKACDFLELTKPRLTSLVLFTTFVGFWVGAAGSVPLLLLFHTMAGTALVAGGASAFNMYTERELDVMMKRTVLRPLASRRLKAGHALLFALGISAAGFVYLFVFVNHLTSLLSAIIFAGYIFFYTPLKTKTWLCTFTGALPGALPIVMGWTAANGALALGAAVLFAIVFLWQIPHFYAIGWMYREDYAKAGFSMLSVVDASGRRTARQAIFFIALLIVATLLPVPFGKAGILYLSGAAILNSIFMAYGIHFARLRSHPSARQLFVCSALYLPALLILLMLDSLVV